jgi:cytochrome c biogenesis protein CcmG, thiol:disulfide interchange protein DsbE
VKKSQKTRLVVAGVAAVALIALLFAMSTQETGVAFGTPTVAGDPLPPFPDAGGDPAIGMVAPTVSGADWDLNGVEIVHDGTPKLIVFLAHWCPHCQREVPVIQDWLDANGSPAGVEMYTVATFINPTRPNFPPSAWLEAEGWSLPTVLDDESFSIAASYGLNAVPAWAVIDGAGQVLGRVTGEIGVAGLNQLVELALQGG